MLRCQGRYLVRPARCTNVARLDFCPPLGTRFGPGWLYLKTYIVKKANSEVRKKWVTIRMNEAEYESLNTLFSKSTCRQLSEYIRDVVLQKPITIKYRNKSLDEILSAFITMIKELNPIGNNFNQAVHKLHTLDRIPEFRNWIQSHENTWETIAKTLTEMKERMDQIYRQWSLK